MNSSKNKHWSVYGLSWIITKVASLWHAGSLRFVASTCMKWKFFVVFYNERSTWKWWKNFSDNNPLSCDFVCENWKFAYIRNEEFFDKGWMLRYIWSQNKFHFLDNIDILLHCLVIWTCVCAHLKEISGKKKMCKFIKNFSSQSNLTLQFDSM